MITNQDWNSSILTDNVLSACRNAQSISDISLSTGQMGIAVALYWLGKVSNVSEANDMASKLLDSVTNKITIKTPLNFSNGLSGIGYAIVKLIENKIINYNECEYLTDLDNHFYVCLNVSVLTNGNVNQCQNTILDILLYLCARLRFCDIHQEDYIVLSRLIAQSFDGLYFQLKEDFFDEPIPPDLNYKLPKLLNIMADMYRLNIHRERVLKCLEELKYKVLTTIPYELTNKLFYLNTILSLYQVTKNSRWIKWANTIFNTISIEEELTGLISNNICSSRGLFEIISGAILVNKTEHKDIHFDEGILIKYLRLAIDKPHKQLCVNQSALFGNLGLIMLLLYIESGKK